MNLYYMVRKIKIVRDNKHLSITAIDDLIQSFNCFSINKITFIPEDGSLNVIL